MPPIATIAKVRPPGSPPWWTYFRMVLITS